MPKKKPPAMKASKTLQIRVRESDLEAFRTAAEREGFNGISPWVLYHLRRISQQSSRSS